MAASQPAFDTSWDVYQYFTHDLFPRPSVLPVPEFFLHHLNESLLNKTAALRPTANEAHLTFQFSCRFLHLPVFQLLVDIRPHIPYSQWKTLADASLSERDILLQIARLYEEMGEMEVAAVVRREWMYLDLGEIGSKENDVIDLDGSDLNDGNYRPTIQQLERLIKLNPHDLRLWNRLCQIHIINGNDHRAITFCKKGMQELRSNPSPFLALSNIYARKGEYDKAMLSFMKHFDNNEYSLPILENSFSSSSSNLVKPGTLKSLASALAAWDSSDESMTLHLAAWTGNTEAVSRFVRNCSDGEISSVDKPALTPLHLAAWNMHTELAKTLMNYNKTWVNTQDEEGWTPLHIAALNGDTPLIGLLLEAKADAEAQIIRNSGRPMHWAAEGGHADAIKALIAVKADISAKDLDDGTPLHCAAAFGHVDAVRALKAAGADVAASDKTGLTPLHLAAEHQHLKVIDTLVGLGADISSRDKHGSTPIHYAARSGDPYVIRVLAKLRAEISPRDKSSSTPLHEATKNGHGNAVKVLIERGADVSARDDKGKTPRDYALSNEELLALFPKKRYDAIESHDSRKRYMDSTESETPKESGFKRRRRYKR